MPAPLHQQRVMGDLLGKCVLENGFDVADRRLLVDELPDLEVAKHRCDLVFGLARNLSSQVQWKFFANHCERLEQIFVIRRQTIDT